MDFTSIKEKITAFIREECEKAGYTLVNIHTKMVSGLYMEVVLDKEGGISLSECGAFNRKVSAWIDREGIIPGEYTIDVCSPGLDREIRSDSEFIWATGKEVEIHTREAIDGKHVIGGKLLEVDDEKGVMIEKENGEKTHIDGANVARVRLRVKI